MTTTEFISTITSLIETFLSLKSEVDAANEAKRAFEDAPAPRLKEQYESIDDWVRDAALIKLYDQKKNELEAARRASDAVYKQAERKLMDILPRRTWFKFGDNWGW